ncbi:MAG: alginate biosynthesis protein Alg44 [Candidatus Azotimanducaceae bacterium]|jgi:alginate biosynthesis protein Alg44
MTETLYSDVENPKPVPLGFGFENEHPMLTMPFSMKLGDQRINGIRISVTDLEMAVPSGTMVAGRKGVVTLTFPFEGFEISFAAQVTATDRGDVNTSVLLFSEPTGAHLAQLRYIMNSYIGGDIVTLNGLMSYSGPTQPKSPKTASKKSIRDRIRSIGVALLSLMLALIAVTVVFSRYNSAYEQHPVFIDRAGLPMLATVSGQLTYLNADAPAGEVAYSIASNTGDVLSFQMPRDGEVALASEIFEGATVLPTDLIMTILDIKSLLRLRTLISIEGLTRALQGDAATLELSDGRTMPVTIKVRDTTRAATLRGDLFVPIDLKVDGESLSPTSINLAARLRLSKTLWGTFDLWQESGK